MEPITLRLPTDLLEELDTESEEAGFSSRSEYVRHLLFNRPDLSQLATTDTSTATPETERVEELDQTVDELTERIELLTQRVTDLEGEPASSDGDSSSSSPSSPMSSTPETPSTDGESPTGERSNGDAHSADSDTDLAEFEHWLESDGPQSANARAVLLDAAQILDEQGPLKASDLRQQLFNRHPETYDSAEALWASTVERLYDDLPGFDRPEYGQYTFNQGDL